MAFLFALRLPSRDLFPYFAGPLPVRLPRLAGSSLRPSVSSSSPSSASTTAAAAIGRRWTSPAPPKTEKGTRPPRQWMRRSVERARVLQAQHTCQKVQLRKWTAAKGRQRAPPSKEIAHLPLFSLFNGVPYLQPQFWRCDPHHSQPSRARVEHRFIRAVTAHPNSARLPTEWRYNAAQLLALTSPPGAAHMLEQNPVGSGERAVLLG